jgi:hypothetical protein
MDQETALRAAVTKIESLKSDSLAQIKEFNAT